jgi:hypothetical protein
MSILLLPLLSILFGYRAPILLLLLLLLHSVKSLMQSLYGIANQLAHHFHDIQHIAVIVVIDLGHMDMILKLLPTMARKFSSKNREFLKYFVSDQISSVSSSYFQIVHHTRYHSHCYYLKVIGLSLPLDVFNVNQIASSITVALVSKSNFIE